MKGSGKWMRDRDASVRRDFAETVPVTAQSPRGGVVGD